MTEANRDEFYHKRPALRFAPSPTGRLHLGNLRTAAVNALAARKFGGGLQLRIEDTDRARADDSRVAGIVSDLAWMGIEWTGESSGVPFRQSSRAASHAAALEKLRATGRAYPCFCSPAELDRSRRMAVAAGRPPRYSGKCGRLSAAEGARRIATGEAHAVRFRLPETGEIAFEDLARGRMVFSASDIGDFVARRANGDFSFFFASAVDDAECGVGIVLRGDDHLANTPRQLALLAALDLPAPRYGHLSLMTDADGGPLSKRADSAAIADLRAAGFLPRALWNYLARTAGIWRERGELATAEELAAGFDFGLLSRSPTRHDEAQLRHWQKLSALSLTDSECAEWLGESEEFAAAVRENVTLPSDAAAWRTVAGLSSGDVSGTGSESDADIVPDASALEAIREAGSDFFRAAAEVVSESGTGSGDDWKSFAARVSAGTGRKGRGLFRPLRAALTGRVDGPQMAAMFKLMGPTLSKRRLERATNL